MTDQIDKTIYDDLGKSLEDLLEDIKNLHDIVDIAHRGISVTQAMPQVAKVLMKVEGENESNKNAVDNAERIAKIAKSEIDNGFPFLYSQAALMLYSYLEGSVKRFITTFLKNNSINEIKEFNNLKISIGEYLSLDDNEKYEYLFQQYEKTVAIGIQYGVTRFETLLHPIGFSGHVEEETTKNIYELSQIRNNILHRGAVADRFLIKNCPWLNYKLNDKVKVNKSSFDKFSKAITSYLMLIAIRLGEKRGKDMSEFKTQK